MATINQTYGPVDSRLSETKTDGQATNYTLDLNTGLPNVLSDGTHTYAFGLHDLSQSNATQTDYFLGDPRKGDNARLARRASLRTPAGSSA